VDPQEFSEMTPLIVTLLSKQTQKLCSCAKYYDDTTVIESESKQAYTAGAVGVMLADNL